MMDKTKTQINLELYKKVLDFCDDFKEVEEIVASLKLNMTWARQSLYRLSVTGYLDTKRIPHRGQHKNTYKRTEDAYRLLAVRVNADASKDLVRIEKQREYQRKYASVKSSNRGIRTRIIELIDGKQMLIEDIAKEVGLLKVKCQNIVYKLEEAHKVESIIKTDDECQPVVYWQKKVVSKGSVIVNFDKLENKLVEQNRLITKDHHKSFRNAVHGGTISELG